MRYVGDNILFVLSLPENINMLKIRPDEDIIFLLFYYISMIHAKHSGNSIGRFRPSCLALKLGPFTRHIMAGAATLSGHMVVGPDNILPAVLPEDSFVPLLHGLRGVCEEGTASEAFRVGSCRIQSGRNRGGYHTLLAGDAGDPVASSP